MHISTVYVLFAAEFILLLIAVCLFLVFYIYKHPSRPTTEVIEDAERSVEPGTSYIEYLEKELLRNQAKSGQQTRIENEDAADSEPPDADEQTAEEKISRLLNIREHFLNAEKSAAQHSENEHAYWDSIYAGMKQLLEEFASVQTETVVIHEESVEHKKQSSEKVFYIETQGRKIDGEVNKLKDIIYEQENLLSSLKKSLAQSGSAFAEDEKELALLHSQLDDFERQLKESRICMEVLELENNRLQEEVSKLESHVGEPAGSSGDDQASKESSSMFDLKAMREVLDKQEKQIAELHQTIEGLALEAGQAERLKATINDFARTSQEMMGCISILEEENEHLKEQLHEVGGDSQHMTVDAAGDEQIKQLKSSIRNLEEEIIKKDVNYAKLQDEFSSMEKEYLAMYEAMHGDQS